MSARVHGDLAKKAHPSEKILKLRLKRGAYRFNEDGELELRCSKCKEYWPADTEFFYAGGADSKDGLSTWCKACHIEWRYPNSRGAVGHIFPSYKDPFHNSGVKP